MLKQKNHSDFSYFGFTSFISYFFAGKAYLRFTDGAALANF